VPYRASLQLELSGVTKRFGKVLANDDVYFRLDRSEVVGLLGENGAGKTTLMNVVFGLYRADEGTIRIEGKPVDIDSTATAIANGISMVHQEPQVVGRHTVLENIIAGDSGKHGLIDTRSALTKLNVIKTVYGLHLDHDRLASSLAAGEKQRLEIIKALFRNARILILDEPTSVLTPIETDGLFRAIDALKADGVGIVFISHKLNEVRAVTERVVVMRRGVVVATAKTDSGLTNAELARLMCGHEPQPMALPPVQIGDNRLELRDVVLATGNPERRPKPITLNVRSGEIVGVAGVSGNGQVALAETIAGLRRPRSGSLVLEGRSIDDCGPRELQSIGLSYIPEDRLGSAFAGGLSAAENLVLSRFLSPPFSRFGWLDRSTMHDFAVHQMAAYDLRPPNPDQPMGSFSGGNQQKALVGRELAFAPQVLVIAQPTRGLDVSAAAFVHDQIIRERDRGCAIVLISDDLAEIFELSDRIVAMYVGTIVCDVERRSATLSVIGLAISGVGTAVSATP
jgi:simple sugar transport system ATP-binding protein